MFKDITDMYANEFKGYNADRFRRDLFAGMTVAAVALPLALAFGIASGGTAAAGVVTAIIASITISLLGGSSYMITGPTGAIAGVVIAVAIQNGIEAVWISGFFGGVILLLIGIFRLGVFVNKIPQPVVVGFTTGIAFIIAASQLDGIFGVSTKSTNLLEQLSQYTAAAINPFTIITTIIVAVLMVLLPKIKAAEKLPIGLISITIASLISIFLGWNTPNIGDIPPTVVLADRLGLSSLTSFDPSLLLNYLSVGLAIALIAGIEGLLTGRVVTEMAEKQNGEAVPFYPNKEMVAQGISNMLLPFFGAVPAGGAIARSTVNVKSGAVTRLANLINALTLLVVALFLGSIIGQIPIAALAGVVIMIAWRMYDWDDIFGFARTNFVGAMIPYLVTFLVTIIFNLTWAIIAGTALYFLLQFVSPDRSEV